MLPSHCQGSTLLPPLLLARPGKVRVRQTQGHFLAVTQKVLGLDSTVTLAPVHCTNFLTRPALFSTSESHSVLRPLSLFLLQRRSAGCVVKFPRRCERHLRPAVDERWSLNNEGSSLATTVSALLSTSLTVLLQIHEFLPQLSLNSFSLFLSASHS